LSITQDATVYVRSLSRKVAIVIRSSEGFTKAVDPSSSVRTESARLVP